MLDKQKSQQFIQNLAVERKFLRLLSATGLKLFLALFLYSLAYTNSAAVKAIVSPTMHTIIPACAAFYIFVLVAGTVVYEAKLKCPKCTKRFFGHPKLVSYSRRAKCPQCGLELRAIEKAADTRIPFAID